MSTVHKRYLREFNPAICACVVLIVLFVPLVPGTHSTLGRGLLALLPLAPIVLVIRAIVRVIRDQDELERRIDLEAIAIAAMTTGLGYVSFGLMLSAGVGWRVEPTAVAIWVMPCLFGSFGAAKLLVARRYRTHA
jgi:hypothetical protein